MADNIKTKRVRVDMDFKEFRERLKKEENLTLYREGIEVEVSLLGDYLRCTVDGAVNKDLAQKIVSEDRVWTVIKVTNQVDEEYYNFRKGSLALNGEGELVVIIGPHTNSSGSAWVSVYTSQEGDMITRYLDEVDAPPDNNKNKFNKMVFDAGKRFTQDLLLKYTCWEPLVGKGEFFQILMWGSDGNLVEELAYVKDYAPGSKTFPVLIRGRDGMIISKSRAVGWIRLTKETFEKELNKVKAKEEQNAGN